MPELQRLSADHAQAVLAFEVANRAYFARFISDRGDEFFDRFTEQYDERLAEQEAGTCAFHVLLGEDGSVLGRFNLVDIEDGTAVLGYRVAAHVAGRGVATATVRELCRTAPVRYGLRTLKAAVTDTNVASRKVLTKAGFVPVGPADIGGKRGTWYERDLADRVDDSPRTSMRDASSFVVRPVAADQWKIVSWLWQCFRHDLAPIVSGLPYADGRYQTSELRTYPAPDRCGYLAWRPHPKTGEDAPIGFALVDGLDGERRSLASMWVAPVVRGEGVGMRLALDVIARHLGAWTIAFQHDNPKAGAFWRRVADAAFGSGCWREDVRAVPGLPDVPPDHWIETV